MAGLLERVRTELAEHLDINDASRVSRALDEEGPVRALELLGSLSPPPASHPDVPKQVALARLASIERLKGRLFQLMFDYRACHRASRESRGACRPRREKKPARTMSVRLIEALIRQGRD